MNFFVEAIGIIAGMLIYGAMAIRNLIIIKCLLLAGSIGFLTYGVILGLPAVIVVNLIGICIGIYGIINAIKKRERSTIGSASGL